MPSTMKNAVSLLIAVLICLTVTLQAGEITIQQAKKVANSFYFERNSNIKTLDFKDNFIEKTYPVSISTQTVMYFINFIDGGWVAISGYDATIPIIAYSISGNYNSDFQPDNFKAWVSQYKSQIYEAINSNVLPSKETLASWSHYLYGTSDELSRYKQGRSVEPMIVSTWDQGLYYNEMCPPDAGPGGHCLTGCVPTCMGQIANYFRWPQTGVGSYSYDGGIYGTLSANFGESYYNYNEMPASAIENSLAMAQLIYHLGVSCDIVYGPSSSGMYNHKAAYSLRTYFKYSPETQYLYRDSTNLNWDSVIIAHLDQKIPMYYAGWSVPNINGHAFVCDGYQNDNYFHFNWGWSGSNDGYFYTGNLNPGGNNFNLAQELIINCFPDTVAYTYPLYCSGSDTLRSNIGTIGDGSGPIYNYTENQECSWLISPVDSVEFITISFYNFETDVNDTLFIYDGSSDNSSMLGAFSGSAVPEDIISSGDELFVKFKSDNQGVAQGWLFGYSSEKPVFCSNNVIIEPTGNISDGSGPANYQNLTTCIWMIQPTSSEEIELSFTEFSTEYNHDFVSVYDGSDKIGEFSGNELPPPQIATSGMMTIVFSTNSSNTENGWQAYFSTGTVGVDHTDGLSQVKLFPVPANNLLNIDCSNSSKITHIKIYNIMGKEVLSMSDSLNGIKNIDTSSLLDGVYLIDLSNAINKLTRKIVISH